MNTSQITHNEAAQNFTLNVDDAEATLQYHLSKRSVSDDHTTAINFTHTFVPPEFRGKGLAESLVRTGLKWADDEGYDISASCWYVQKFLK